MRGMLPPITQEELLSPQNGWMLLVTVCIGGLVGLVRQWRGGNNTTAGMRTFGLWAVLGFIAVQMERLGFAHFVLATLFVLGLSTTAYLLRGGKERKRETESYHATFGLTTAASALMVFCAGALMGLGLEKYAVMLAIVLAVTLGSRAWTDKWSSSLTGTDIRAGLQFACLTGVLLPLVPNQTLWGVFNPYATWLMVVVITGVNFVGYIAMRWLGARAGAALTGFIGGLASSTAVTLALSRRSAEEPENGGAFATAILLAQVSMALRLVVLTLLLNLAFALSTLWMWAVLLGACVAVCGLIALRHRTRAEGSVPAVKNPLDLGTAVKFALLYAVVVFLVEKSGNGLGTGFVAVSFFSGIPDTAALVMSMANQASATAEAGTLGFGLAALGIMLGVLSNTLVKLAIALVVGRGEFRLLAAGGLGVSALVNCGLAVALVLGGV